MSREVISFALSHIGKDNRPLPPSFRRRNINEIIFKMAIDKVNCNRYNYSIINKGGEDMRRLWVLLLVLVMGLAVAGCSGASDMNSKKPDSMTSASTKKEDAKMGYHKISPEEAKKMMDENKMAVVLDVRTSGEYAEKHIPGARLVPNENISDQPIEGLKKDDVILVYCRSGNRSKQASDKLVKMGYKNVYDFGGINSWPYATESGAYQGM